MCAKKKIPISLITGYLGSGKTTLISKILANPGGKKIAVLVNEFAEVGVDGEIFKGLNENSPILELSNGCLCCVVTGEFKTALASLKETHPDLDWVIIETSGAADPESIVKILWGAPEITKNFTLDGTICVADATRIEELLEKNPVVLKQVLVADRILLTKTDRVTSIENAKAALSQRNSWAEVIPCDLTQSHPEIFPLEAYTAKFFSMQPAKEVTHSLQTHSHSWEGEISPAEMQKFFRALLVTGENPKPIRLKAIFHVRDEATQKISRFLIQGVGDWIEKTKLSYTPSSQKPLNRFVAFYDNTPNARRLDLPLLSR